MDQDETDEILGITRCARCGQRLDNELECPFCTGLSDEQQNEGIPKWVFLTACFLTSPLSLYAIIKSDKLNTVEKILALCGCIIWLGIYRLWFL